MADIYFITPRKKCIMCIIGLISFAIMFGHQAQWLREDSRSIRQRNKKTEGYPHFSLSSIHGKRTIQLSGGCMPASLALGKNQTLTFANTIHEAQQKSEIFFTLRSHSLMYCAALKAATSTLRSIMIYVHLQEIYNHVTGDRIVPDFIGIPSTKLANMIALIETLRKVK
jgi:hypothetical protein